MTNKKIVQKVVLAGVVVRDGKVQLSNEHRDFAWITESEVADYGITDPVQKVIRGAFEILSKR